MSHQQMKQLVQFLNQPDPPESYVPSSTSSSSSSFSQATQEPTFSHSNDNNNNNNKASTISTKSASLSSKFDRKGRLTSTLSCCFNGENCWVWSSSSGLRNGRCAGKLMARDQGDVSVRSTHSTSDIQKKKLSGQRKREELEKEEWQSHEVDEFKKVSVLQKMLNQEKNVHEILEFVNNQHKGSSFSIPNFLPSKIKELLAELAMVEGEITRLEGQISQLQTNLKHEHEVAKAASKSKQGSLQNPINLIQINESVRERMSFQTKAMHFINKAIKRNYNANELRLNEKMGNIRGFMNADREQKENKVILHDQELKDREHNKVPIRRSGLILKPFASPLRDPRYPSPYKSKERNTGIYLDLATKSQPIPFQLEEETRNMEPNKLSENIMKCLIVIYIRLLRTSRAMELEKSGPISRTMDCSLTSRSFRVENGLKTSGVLQKELRQQDPYGIFHVEDSIPRDIGPYKNLVMLTSTSMDTASISTANSIPLLRKLRVFMNSLQTVDLRSMTYQQKLAFWINMYNACIMHGFLQYGVPSSPEKLLALLNKATVNIGGNIINARAIERYILRKPVSSNKKEAYYKSVDDDKEGVVRQLYGLESINPNIAFALCCGTRSSPAVRIYTADGVISELEKSKLEYLQASIIVTNSKMIAIPELLVRNMLDCAVDIHSLMECICHQLPSSGSLRKSMVECLKSSNNKTPSSPSTRVEKIPYDFEFLYLLAI